MSTMNRLNNARNPYQGDAKRVLVVCSAGLLRSPTVANLLAREYGYNTRAVGYNEDFALVVLDEVLVSWADEVVWVEPDVRRKARNAHPWLEKYNQDEVVLNLPDNFEYGDPVLKERALEQYEFHLNLNAPKTDD